MLEWKSYRKMGAKEEVAYVAWEKTVGRF